MRRRDFLATAAAVSVSQTQARGRNIVFILSDDHRHDMIGGLGHPWLAGHTPNLDRMIRDGVQFRNAFVTTSLCSPSRASILTSRYMHSHGVSDNFTPLNPQLPTFPKLLQQAGYKTGFFGKWHMGGEGDEPQPGFDQWVSFRGQGEYQDPELNRNGTRQKMKNTTDVLTAEARQFIRDNPSRPFCLYLSHKAVHAPFQAPERHQNLFKGLTAPRPRTMPYKDEFYRQWPEWVRLRRPTRHGVDGAIDSDEPFDVLYRKYCQSLIAIDDSVGEMLAQLEESKLLDDTLVIYMGDNGYMWGEHGLIDKRAMYESSIRVPLLAHCPTLLPKGGKVDRMVLNLDIAPTLLDAAGLKAAQGMQGRSLLPLARGNAVSDWRSDFIYEYAWEQDFPYTPNIVGLRSETHSLMQYPGVWDIPELYDLKDDPDQVNNLLSDTRIGPRMRGRYIHHVRNTNTRNLVRSMQDRIARILEDTGGDARLSGRANEGDKFAF